MAHKMMAETFALNLSMERERVLYVGDSINDEPIFGFFPHAVGVSTARSFLPQMASPPRWITDGPGGDGFVEVADMPLRHR
jgi:3-deoxy-D-manno-octulosonate 8-phosphate phosphatase KdsC-like HAD superfamily phosphatase